MQLLSRHGIFGSYRKSIGKDSDYQCYHCGGPNDDAEHVLFPCPKRIEKRIQLEKSLGEKIDADNIMAKVIAKDENWHKFRQFCKTVMSHRREMEKAAETARRRTSATTTRRRGSSSSGQ
jgi:hypothetical protein